VEILDSQAGGRLQECCSRSQFATLKLQLLDLTEPLSVSDRAVTAAPDAYFLGTATLGAAVNGSIPNFGYASLG
jgi:hypothetical protein